MTSIVLVAPNGNAESRNSYTLATLTPRLENIINSDLESPTDPAVQLIEAQKILSGEFSNREILLKHEDEIGYKIYRLSELARDVTYYTPMGNRILRISTNKAFINEQHPIEIDDSSSMLSKNQSSRNVTIFLLSYLTC